MGEKKDSFLLASLRRRLEKVQRIEDIVKRMNETSRNPKLYEEDAQNLLTTLTTELLQELPPYVSAISLSITENISAKREIDPSNTCQPEEWDSSTFCEYWRQLEYPLIHPEYFEAKTHLPDELKRL